MASPTQETEAFPSLSPVNTASNVPRKDVRTPDSDARLRSGSSGNRKTRGNSLLDSFITSNPPLGMWQATGEVGSKIPTLPEIRDGSFGSEGWSQEGQMERRGANPHDIFKITRARRSSASSRARSNTTPTSTVATFLPTEAAFDEEGTTDLEKNALEPPSPSSQNSRGAGDGHMDHPNTMKPESSLDSSRHAGPDETGTYPNGYRFPKKHSWSQSTLIGLKALWFFFITPLGFLIIIYGLNVIAWGAMIFFLLLNAAPAMCNPSCDDKHTSARQIWIEIDSQVLTALFCVTAFGLIPWRFRDFYYLCQWRLRGNQIYHRKLAGLYRGWYRLPGSQNLTNDVGPVPKPDKKAPQSEESPPAYSEEEILKLEANPALPLPAHSIPDPPLTGVRAQPTKSWNLDMVIWLYIMNTVVQVPLCGVMWGMNRFDRPSWVTGLLVAIGCLSGIFAGVVVFIEGSKVKKAEGIPVHEYDVLESIDDYQQRKAKEDAKQAKKTARSKPTDDRQVDRTEKVKGRHWFVRQ